MTSVTAINVNPINTAASVVSPATLPAAVAILQVKATLGGETRRFHIADPAPSFARLVQAVKEAHGLPEAAHVYLRYKDDEDDLITLSRDSELAEAIRVADGAPLRLIASVGLAALDPASAAAPVTPAAPIPVLPAAAAPAAATPGAPASFAPAWRSPVASSPAASKEATKAAWKHHKEHMKQEKHEQQKQAWLQQCEVLRSRLAAVKEKAAASNGAKAERLAELRDELRRVKEELKESKKEIKRMPREGIVAARFVRDVTAADGTALEPGAAFVKTWRFRNESPRPWPEGTRLLFVGKNSDRMGAPDEVPVAAAAPGQEIDISVPLVAPLAPGRYTAYFRLAGPAGKKFGQRVWCAVSVLGDSSSSADEREGKGGKGGPVSDEDLVKYKHQLEVLAEMNHTDLRRNVRLLRKHEGSLERVVEVLLKKRHKFDRLAAGIEAKVERKIEKKIAKAEEKAAKHC